MTLLRIKMQDETCFFSSINIMFLSDLGVCDIYRLR